MQGEPLPPSFHLELRTYVSSPSFLIVKQPAGNNERLARLGLPILFRSNGGRKLPPLESILRAETQVSFVERLRLGEPFCLLRCYYYYYFKRGDAVECMYVCM